jgi:exopolysaccharide biosynthesis polyprenyl glycosylphosphotransferase
MRIGGGDGMAVEQQSSFSLLGDGVRPDGAPAAFLPRQSVGPQVPRHATGLQPGQGPARIPSPSRAASAPLAPLATPVPRETVHEATPPAVEPDTRSQVNRWVKRHGFAVEFVASVGAGAVAGSMRPGHEIAVGAALAAWAVANFHRGRMLTSPLVRQLQSVLQSAMIPLAGVAAIVGFFGTSVTAVAPVFAAVLASTAVSVALRLVRWRLRVPVRAVVVGDRLAIAQSAAQWARTPDIRLVGALLMEPDLGDADVPSTMLGSPVALGIDEAPDHVARWGADVVLLAQGPGLTPLEFRRLSWLLEDSGVSLGVIGVLDSVAPHRITPGALNRDTVMAVRPPKPSRWIQAVKSGLDRLAAAALLVLFAPVLAATAAAVILDSRGPALFKQTRIGRHGREFEVYKMRTMVVNAEEVKAELLADNEYDGVLFKMKQDPRITRVGRFLRKTSLDELPQLLNVAKGDMSLIGPRPHLPNEIAAMDQVTLRRLAVRPGITGLWQVSGRSDLPSGMASELDTYYADNWTLGGDLAIALRTVKAVLSTKGAY